MRFRHFPIGAFPDVTSDDGFTSVAFFQPGRGVVVYRWQDGTSMDAAETFVDADAQTNGVPMLETVNGEIALAYRRDNPETVAPWGIPTALQWPVIFGEDGRVAAIKFTGEPRIVVGRWPHEPTQDVGRCGSSQGLSHFDGDRVVDRDQARVPFDGNFQNAVRINGAAVGVTGDDRLVVKLGNVTGTLPGVGSVKDPRVTRQQNGALAICWWFDGQPIGVAVDVAATDLIPLTVTPPPPPDDDEPPDEDEPPMPELPDPLFEDVKAERAKYPAVVQPADAGKILNAVAWKHRAKGWGLSVKKAGNNVPSPQGVPVAYDILHHKPSDTLWGCFTAPAGNDWALIVNWGQEEHHHNPDRPWLAPIQPADAPSDPPDDPPDDPPAVDLAPVLQKLDLVLTNQLALKIEIDAVKERVAFIDAEVRKIRARQDSPLAITLGLPRQLATGGTATGDAKPQHKE